MSNEVETVTVNFNGKKYDVVRDVSIEILTDLGATSAINRKKTEEIYTEGVAKYHQLSEKVTLETFKAYMSTVSREQNSIITRDIGRHGYYLRAKNVIEQNVEPEQLSETTGGAPVSAVDYEEAAKRSNERKSLEKQLYPLLSTWLMGQGYRVQMTDTVRRLGKWGNPDITGIKVENHLGNTEIEIATIEAKISSTNYQQDMFQAVSHRRFANRAYFAFAAPFDVVRKSNEELRYYSELYNVGVLVVAMEAEDFEKFVGGEIGKLDMEEIDIYELYSAPFEYKQIRWQKDFLEALEIKDQKSLWIWGDTLEEL